MNRKSNLAKITPRQFVGAAMMIGSICMVFVWGIHFNVFGKPIRLNLQFSGFFFWIMLGIFFLGYGVNGVRSGLIWSGIFILAMSLALAFGVLIGSYR